MNLKLHIIKVCPKLLFGTFFGAMADSPSDERECQQAAKHDNDSRDEAVDHDDGDAEDASRSCPNPDEHLVGDDSVSLPTTIFPVPDSFCFIIPIYCRIIFRQIAHHQQSSRCVYMMSCDMADLLWPPRYMPILMASLYPLFKTGVDGA